ncbi:MAG: hypothetical protein HYY86_00205 [Candidatus Harrisonbacteria bacterium]|nr:hypothetical protein [Candidatus Harrisonbacteria bacterium]
MKFVEAGYREDPGKFQHDFVEMFAKDVAECLGVEEPKALADIFYQLICSVIDAMSIAKLRMADKEGIDVILMRVELIKLNPKGLKFQVIPLNNEREPITTNLEMPALILNPDQEEMKKNLKTGRSIVSFLLPKLPKSN